MAKGCKSIRPWFYLASRFPVTNLAPPIGTRGCQLPQHLKGNWLRNFLTFCFAVRATACCRLEHQNIAATIATESKMNPKNIGAASSSRPCLSEGFLMLSLNVSTKTVSSSSAASIVQLTQRGWLYWCRGFVTIDSMFLPFCDHTLLAQQPKSQLRTNFDSSQRIHSF